MDAVGYEAGVPDWGPSSPDDTKVIPLRREDAARVELERQLDEAFKAKEDAREELLKFDVPQPVLLAAVKYGATLAKYANLVNKLDGMGIHT